MVRPSLRTAGAGPRPRAAALSSGAVTRPQRLLAPALAVALALLLAACGQSGSARPDAAATLELDFQPNAVHAGIYMALARDYTGAEGVGVVARQREVDAGVNRVGLEVQLERRGGVRARGAGLPRAPGPRASARTRAVARRCCGRGTAPEDRPGEGLQPVALVRAHPTCAAVCDLLAQRDAVAVATAGASASTARSRPTRRTCTRPKSGSRLIDGAVQLLVLTGERPEVDPDVSGWPPTGHGLHRLRRVGVRAGARAAGCCRTVRRPVPRGPGAAAGGHGVAGTDARVGARRPGRRQARRPSTAPALIRWASKQIPFTSGILVGIGSRRPHPRAGGAGRGPRRARPPRRSSSEKLIPHNYLYGQEPADIADEAGGAALLGDGHREAPHRAGGPITIDDMRDLIGAAQELLPGVRVRVLLHGAGGRARRGGRDVLGGLSATRT